MRSLDQDSFRKYNKCVKTATGHDEDACKCSISVGEKLINKKKSDDVKLHISTTTEQIKYDITG